MILFVSTAALHGAEPKEQTVTKSYDVADLLHREGKTGFDSADEITRLIIETVNPKSWQLNGDTANRLFVVNGTRLEIMEFTPVQKACCHPYTADHPKP